MQMNKFKYILPILAMALLFSACKYDFILPEEIIVVDPDNPDSQVIGFAEYVMPIFNNNCIACHKTGGQVPNLTTGNAYSSLNTSRYINKAAPAESLIYTKPSPNAGGSHKKYTEAEAAIVLAWITQGAKNN